jgi:hypothetical protein
MGSAGGPAAGRVLPGAALTAARLLAAAVGAIDPDEPGRAAEWLGLVPHVLALLEARGRLPDGGEAELAPGDQPGRGRRHAGDAAHPPGGPDEARPDRHPVGGAAPMTRPPLIMGRRYHGPRADGQFTGRSSRPDRPAPW